MNSYHRDYDPRLRYALNREECRERTGVNWPFIRGAGIAVAVCVAFWYVVAPKLWHLAYRVMR